jgi:hypothetical protein
MSVISLKTFPPVLRFLTASSEGNPLTAGTPAFRPRCVPGRSTGPLGRSGPESGAVGPRADNRPPVSFDGVKPLRGEAIRTLDFAPHPPAPPGLTGCADNGAAEAATGDTSPRSNVEARDPYPTRMPS